MNKCLLLIWGCVLSVNLSYAQQYKWIKGGGASDYMQAGWGYDQVKHICTDENKNIYILAQIGDHSLKVDTFSLNQAFNTGAPNALTHILFASYDCNGKMRFAKLLEAKGDNFGSGLLYHAGKVYVSGSLYGIGKRIGYDANLSSIGNYPSTFLAKFDTSGQYHWCSFIGTNVIISASGSGKWSSISIDGQGNIHLFNTMMAGVQITSSVISQTGTYDLTYDVNGNLLNASLLQMADTTYGMKKAVIDKATGKVYALFERSPATITNAQSRIAAFTNNGNLLWMDTVGLRGAVAGLKYMPKDGLYLSGGSNGTYPFSVGGKSVSNGTVGTGAISTIAKLDTNGIAKWIYKVDGSIAVMGFNALDVLPDYSIVATGIYGGQVKYNGKTMTIPPGEFWNPILMIIDTSGNLIKLDQLHGTGQNNSGLAIVSDKAGSIYIGGMLDVSMYAGNLTPYNSQGGDADFFVMKYGYDCSCTGAEPKPTSSFTSIVSDTINKKIQFTFTGTNPADSIVWDFGDGNDTTLNNPTHQYPVIGTYTVCATVYKPCNKAVYCKAIVIPAQVGINNIFNENGIRVYPNPINDALIVEGLSVNTKIQLFDVMGRLIYKTISTEDKTIINTSDFQIGTYMLQFIDEHGNRIAKTIVKR